ncbi:MAG TPA: aromatic ring-opening dioxygenase subunit LigB [Thermomicrobiales bacterium]|nr:aromatic ring-opening dioxygenase subunit LigB [Thermomicrobiales bacterium]
MPLVAAAMMPHGFTLIPEVSDGKPETERTTAAMQEIGRRFADAGVEAIVLVGPHGTRVTGQMCVMDVGRAAGSLSNGERSIDVNVPCDRPLIEAIIEASRQAGVPVAAAGFGGNRADQSVAPLDWGGVIPLWFTGHDDNRPDSGSVLAATPADDHGPTVVLITPARALPLEKMVEFGHVIADVIAADSRKVGFIASCDWAHTHTESGPYGAHPKAPEVDARVVKAVRANTLHDLAEIPPQDVEAAAIDGLWQSLILAGIQDRTPLTVDFLSYEVPDYFGMIVAAYAPVR